jgi:hypothetical protein
MTTGSQGPTSPKSHNVTTSWVHRTPIGFARAVSDNERAWCEAHFLAGEFLRAGNTLGVTAAHSNGAPVYVLYIHAIEMALKSYLLRKGLTKDKVRGYRHGLLALLDEARNRGLVTTEAYTDHIVSELKKATDKATIRYDMPYQMPLTNDVRDVATAIIADTEPPTPMPGDGIGA